MNKEARKFSEILNIPGVWVELCFSNDWYSEINDAKYFVTQNKKIVDANTGTVVMR